MINSFNTCANSFIRCQAEIDIHTHKSWYGYMSGLKAEKLLRGLKTPYIYLLRAGEFEGEYYVTFLRPDYSIAHQPFIIGLTETGFFCENGCGTGITDQTPFSELLFRIMHCEKDECIPYISE